MNINVDKIKNIPKFLQGDKTLTKELWEERRQKIIGLLCEEEYGFLPPPPLKMSWETVETDNEFCAGKAPLNKILLNITLHNGNIFTLPVNTVIPVNENKNSKNKIPFFVYISFNADTPCKFLPSEEIADNGFAVFSFNYQDAASDDGDFDNGLSKALGISGNASLGKIALWAWAAMRVMDYASTLQILDKTRASIAGHSRLGKTALLAGAIDTRFEYIISNNSGCCGAAVSRGKKGETISDIAKAFPFWFKSSFKKYSGNEDSLPFDQHFLLAASAPRRVYISSSSDDLWADPDAEFLSCILAGDVWTKLGLPALVCSEDARKTRKDSFPLNEINKENLYHGGNVAYHLREGAHYLSREDWRLFMSYIKKSTTSP